MEASLSVTLFLLIVVYMISYLTMINQEFGKQIFINNLSKKMSKTVYYLDVADKIIDSSDTFKAQKEKIKELAENGKTTGIRLTDSILKDGNVDIILEYMQSPLIWKHYFLIKQRSVMKDWTGVDISKDCDIVYITKTGKVYHRTKSCRHLMLMIQSQYYANVMELKNENGAKYRSCERCVQKIPGMMEKVYITTDGKKYHTALECPGLTRYIIETDITKIGNRKACSACGGG